mmetsp:Transcript_19520/g.58816  ORF Transcript_19520/g.58816 Transcript_19520/m.58816 type:complete len:370 (+) Transcript_19520:483-1592(+)
MCDCGLHVLVRLLDVQGECDRVLLSVHCAIKAAKVGAAEGALLLEEMRGISALAPSVQGTLQRCPRGSEEVHRAHALRGTAVATGVEHELHALDAGSVEGRAAHGLAWREATPQQRGLFHAPLYPPDHPRAHDLDLPLHLVDQPVVDVTAKDHHALEWLYRGLELVDVSRRRRWFDWMLDLADRLQDLNTNAEGVVLAVDLVLHEAQPLCAVGHAAVEDLLKCRRLLPDKELVDHARPLARPQEHRAVARSLAVHRRIRGSVELELQLQAVRTSHVELGREPAGMQRGLGPRRRRPQKPRDVLDDPVDAARRQVLHLGDGVPELGGLLLHAIEPRLCVLPQLRDLRHRALLGIIRVRLRRDLQLFQLIL